MISPMTSSATERELEKGELKTAIPCLAAWTRSTWFVPIQKQPMARSYRSAPHRNHSWFPSLLGGSRQ